MIPTFLRWLRALVPDVPDLERAKADERARHIAQQDTASGAPRRVYSSDPTRVTRVEPIRAGSLEALFNAADPGCPACHGMGRLSARDDNGRGWTACPCTFGRDEYGDVVA